MMEGEPTRPDAEIRAEYDHLVSSFALNESTRDSFLATAHTAVFAASIAFLGDITSFADARWKPLVVLGWIAGATGMVALTASFYVASKELKRRIAELRQRAETSQQPTARLNEIALCSLPVSVVCLAAFAISNVVLPMSQGVKFDGAPAIDERKQVDAGVMAAPRLDGGEREALEKGIAAAPRMPDDQQNSSRPSEPAETQAPTQNSNGKSD